jgi:hypothetical protein
MRVKLYTTAFRMVQEVTLPNLPAGPVKTQVPLVDKKGHLLANGLYYIVIFTPQGHSVGKLLITR